MLNMLFSFDGYMFSSSLTFSPLSVLRFIVLCINR